MKRRYIFLGVMLFVMAVLFPHSTPDGHKTDPKVFQELLMKIETRVNEGAVPSVSLAVLQNGKVALMRTFGYMDENKRIKADENTRYTIGSLSKSITATGLMVLVERGVIDLDESVNTYLKDTPLTLYRGNEKEVTVRRLLNCTAGIPHGWYVHNALQEHSFVETADYLNDFGKVVFPPGETYLYSNHAYGIAAKIIESVSGKSYDQFMQEEVFSPIGMKHTFSNFNDIRQAHVAPLYKDGETILSYGTFTGPIAAAGLYSSLSDLIKYSNLHLGFLKDEGPLSKNTLRRMHTANDSVNPYRLMALGWHHLRLRDNESVLISNGEVYGGNATLILLPSENTAVVVLANRSFSPSISDEIGFEAVEAMSPGFMEKLGTFIQEYEENVFEAYRPSDRFKGVWKGKIVTSTIEKNIFLNFQQDGDIHVGIEGQKATLLNEAIFEHGILTGSCAGFLTKDAPLDNESLQFHVREKNGEIYGYVAHIVEKNTNVPNRFPKSMVRTAYIELKKHID